MGKKRRIATDSSTALEHNALAGLGALMSDVPDADVVPAASASEPTSSSPEVERSLGRLVVRREKKGRGGKAATVIEGLRMEATELESLARRVRKDLACGAHVEGGDVVLQGAQTERARAWLLEHGAKTVIVGN